MGEPNAIDDIVPEEPPQPVTEVRKRHCSVCGQTGHRFESCPVRPPGMTAPPRRPSTLADRARQAGHEPPPQTKPRAGRAWEGHLDPAEGFEGVALRKVERLQHDIGPRTRKLVQKLEEATPLTELLHDWRARYGLTPEESEVLFNVALDVMPSHKLAALAEVSGDEIHARGVSVASKTGTRSVTHAALQLTREALVFATFDWEKRQKRAGSSDDEDGDG